MELPAPYRVAVSSDSPEIARLADLAGDGIVRFAWAQEAAPGQDAMEFGIAECEKPDSWCSYTNALVADIDGEVAALALSYPLLANEADKQTDRHEHPLIAQFKVLEKQAIGSFYLDSLAVGKKFRRRGLARQLINLTARKAVSAGYKEVSLQAFEQNRNAVALYEQCGFTTIARHPCVPHECHSRTGDLLLMMKSLKAVE